MGFHTSTIKLADSRRHGAGTELFIVEGDSAASAVAALRDSNTQAVLPMQGKPLNAIKAGPAKVQAYGLFRALNDCLVETPTADLFASSAPRFERIILLFDPDADGIPSSALMLMYFYQYLRPWLDSGKIELIHAPWLQITVAERSEPVYAYSEAHSQALLTDLRAQNVACQIVRYRGLAGIDGKTLFEKCISPATRRTRVMSAADALAAIEVFGGAPKRAAPVK